ncbi:MAG: glycosyltransferase [Paludibacteraceae bacterium]|nr:glycosyltransferase [Paludibacteraceae bacterium]
MKILFITPWYPSVNDLMSGLFVQTIVQEAERRGVDCRVICSTKTLEMVREARRLAKRWGKPDLIHLHVTTKQGLLPLMAKRFCGVPYVVTEHWSGYLPENGDYNALAARPVVGRLYRWMTRKIVGEAEVVTAVSDLLRRNMRRCGLDNRDFRVIHNVVDPVFEENEVTTTPAPMSFLHVSCFSDRAKNTTGIIEAAKILKERGVVFSLTMLGDGPDLEMTKRLSSEYGLEGTVTFTGVLEPVEVAEQMHRHQCLILFSNFETAAVVLQEAMSVGMKIISTPVGIAEEYKERITLVPKGDVNALVNAMTNLDETTNRSKISFSKVGDEYFALYKQISQH